MARVAGAYWREFVSTTGTLSESAKKGNWHGVSTH